MNTAQFILEDIKKTINEEFNMKITDVKQINRGLLNLKWSATSDNKIFIKQYNKERYNSSKIEKIKARLKIQMLLNDNGVLCPSIYEKNGNLMYTTDSGEDFIITNLINGKIIEYGEMNESQSYHLGICIGRMHYVLNEILNISEPYSWKLPTKEKLLKEWEMTYNSQTFDENSEIKAILLNQKKLLQEIDMNDFLLCKEGWSHSDLWSHNLLFNEDKIAGFLDFDRLSVTYPELDNARVLLSLALKNNVLNIRLVESFIKGYCKYYIINEEDIVRSIKLLWCLESFWWFKEQYLNTDNPPNRMMNEMIWVMENWDNLLIDCDECK